MNLKLVASSLALLAGLCASALAADPVRFMVMGDCRNYPGFTTILEKVKALPDGPGSFVVTPGDIDPPDLVRAEITKVLGDKYTWFPVVGNHDATKTAIPYLRKYFSKEQLAALPPQVTNFTPGPEGTSETTYSFDAGPVHFVVTNQYWDGTTKADADIKVGGDVLPVLNQWLDADLKKTTKPWKVVFGHEPAYPQADQDWSRLEPNSNTARHAGSSLNAHEEHRDAFIKTLVDNKVAVFFCGHTHRYSRFQIPGTNIWQLDSAVARGGTDWKFDAFTAVTATETEFKVKVYRNLKTKGEFEETDKLELKAGEAAASQPATQATSAPTAAKNP